MLKACSLSHSVLREIKRLAAQTKTVKVQALGGVGGMVVIDRSAILSLSFALSRSLIFLWLSRTMPRLSCMLQSRPPLMLCDVVSVSI